jgi:hypothetical protein
MSPSTPPSGTTPGFVASGPARAARQFRAGIWSRIAVDHPGGARAGAGVEVAGHVVAVCLGDTSGPTSQPRVPSPVRSLLVRSLIAGPVLSRIGVRSMIRVTHLSPRRGCGARRAHRPPSTAHPPTRTGSATEMPVRNGYTIVSTILRCSRKRLLRLPSENGIKGSISSQRSSDNTAERDMSPPSPVHPHRFGGP